MSRDYNINHSPLISEGIYALEEMRVVYVGSLMLLKDKRATRCHYLFGYMHDVIDLRF